MSDEHFIPLVIKASAGTGKTYQLSSRYIKLLSAGETPERILATTFTRKAAAEIQERVFLRVAKRALAEDGPAARRDDEDATIFGEAKSGELLNVLLKQQHRLKICTLDSFFSSIAKNFAFELGLKPQWSIRSGPEEANLVREAIHRVCEKKPQQLGALLRLINRGSYRRSIHLQIENIVKAWHALYRATTRPAWEALTIPKSLDPRELEQLTARHRTIPVPKTAKGGKNKLWETALTRSQSCLEAQDWGKFISQGIAHKLALGEQIFSQQAIDGEILEIYQQLVTHAGSVLLHRLQEQNESTFDLLACFDAEYRELQEENGSLTFDEVKEKLAEAALLDRLEEVYYRLDGRIGHLLLDEFQDTATAEWKVLRPVAAEILSKADLEHTFFCVGDVKQAIYGWRGGRAEIFDSLKDFWDQLDVQTHDTSRRCAQAVIDTVNKVFGTLERNPVLSSNPSATTIWQKRFIEHKTSRKEVGYVALVEARFDTDADGERQRPTAAFKQDAVINKTVALIQSLQPLLSGQSLGILVRRKATVARVIFALRQAGFAASEEGGNPLTDSTAVVTVLALLRLVDHPGDTLARFQVATSPLGEVLKYQNYQDEPGAMLLSRTLVRELEDNGYGQTISRWADTLAAVVAQRDRRRLEQLVDLAYEFDTSSGVRTRRFVEEVLAQHVEDPSSAGIRVMTIHRSKGLEFDCVFLPELDLNLSERHANDALIFRPTPLAAPAHVSRYASEELRGLCPELRAMHEQCLDEKLIESLSLLYVALTRARDALYLVVAERPQGVKDAPLSPAEILRAALLNDQESKGKLALLHECGDSSWLKSCPKTDQAPIQPKAPLPSKLTFLEQDRHTPRSFVHEAPSSLEGAGRRTIGSLLQAKNQTALTRGSLLHRCFEEILWLNGEPAPKREKLIRQLVPLCRGTIDLERLLDEFFSTLNAPGLRALLSEETYQQRASNIEVFREWPFLLREDGRILSGSIDRLVIGREDSRVVFGEVIDFKTDRITPNSADELEQKKEFYRPQLTIYRQAAAQYTGLPVAQINTKLVFIGSALVCELD